MTAFALCVIMAADLLVPDPKLDSIATEAQALAQKEFPKLAADQLGICIGRINRAKKSIEIGQYLGKQPFYPASTIKLFYLSHGATLLESGKLKLTPELERGFRDMIVDSTNDATALILDAITDTTGGPELTPDQLIKWKSKRNSVNRWLTSIGFSGINANQKTWNEGPYGRERQGYGPNFEFRNSLTPESGVHMMALIALQKLVPTERNEWMKGYLSRKIPADAKDADFQSRAFVGSVLPTGTKLWSKAGYTDTVRMDIAWFQLPSGQEWIYAIFTKGQSNVPKLVPFVAERLLVLTGSPSNPAPRHVRQVA